MRLLVLSTVVVAAMVVTALVTYTIIKAPIWWAKLIDAMAKIQVEEWNGWRRGPWC